MLEVPFVYNESTEKSLHRNTYTLKILGSYNAQMLTLE